MTRLCSTNQFWVQSGHGENFQIDKEHPSDIYVNACRLRCHDISKIQVNSAGGGIWFTEMATKFAKNDALNGVAMKLAWAVEIGVEDPITHAGIERGLDGAGLEVICDARARETLIGVGEMLVGDYGQCITRLWRSWIATWRIWVWDIQHVQVSFGGPLFCKCYLMSPCHEVVVVPRITCCRKESTKITATWLWVREL